MMKIETWDISLGIICQKTGNAQEEERQADIGSWLSEFPTRFAAGFRIRRGISAVNPINHIVIIACRSDKAKNRIVFTARHCVTVS